MNSLYAAVNGAGTVSNGAVRKMGKMGRSRFL